MNSDIVERMKMFVDWYRVATIYPRKEVIEKLKVTFPEAFPPLTIEKCDIVELRRRAAEAASHELREYGKTRTYNLLTTGTP